MPRFIGRRAPLTEPLRSYLQDGGYGRTGTDGDFNFDLFMLAGRVMRGDYGQLHALWREHGAIVLADWIAEAPGTRPFAWWVLDATEARRCLRGAEHLLPANGPGAWQFVWRRALGIPAYQSLGHFTVSFEAQATFLARLALLSAAERPALNDEAFEPETITVNVDTYQEIVTRRAEREKGRPV
jgi:hypothetical protein